MDMSNTTMAGCGGVLGAITPAKWFCEQKLYDEIHLHLHTSMLGSLTGQSTFFSLWTLEYYVHTQFSSVIHSSAMCMYWINLQSPFLHFVKICVYTFITPLNIRNLQSYQKSGEGPNVCCQSRHVAQCVRSCPIPLMDRQLPKNNATITAFHQGVNSLMKYNQCSYSELNLVTISVG
mgnify:CR=1 FL=1